MLILLWRSSKHLRIVGQGTPGVKRWRMALADDVRQRIDDLWAKL